MRFFPRHQPLQDCHNPFALGHAGAFTRRNVGWLAAAGVGVWLGWGAVGDLFRSPQSFQKEWRAAAERATTSELVDPKSLELSDLYITYTAGPVDEAETLFPVAGGHYATTDRPHGGEFIGVWDREASDFLWLREYDLAGMRREYYHEVSLLSLNEGNGIVLGVCLTGHLNPIRELRLRPDFHPQESPGATSQVVFDPTSGDIRGSSTMDGFYIFWEGSPQGKKFTATSFSAIDWECSSLAICSSDGSVLNKIPMQIRTLSFGNESSIHLSLDDDGKDFALDIGSLETSQVEERIDPPLHNSWWNETRKIRVTNDAGRPICGSGRFGKARPISKPAQFPVYKVTSEESINIVYYTSPYPIFLAGKDHLLIKEPDSIRLERLDDILAEAEARP